MNDDLQSDNNTLETSVPPTPVEPQLKVRDPLEGRLRELEAVNSELRNLLHGLDIAALLLDPRLNIIRFTPDTARLFRIAAEDAGRPFADITPAVDDPDLRADAQTALERGVALEKEICTMDGECWYRRRIQPCRAQNDAVEGLIVSFVDITASKRAEQSLRKAKQAAEAANRSKTRFLSAVSHDLGQPLQALSLLNGVLARRTVGSELRGIVDKQQASLASMQHLLNGLLDQCRLDAGTINPEVTDFPASELLEGLEQEFAPDAAARGLALRVDTSDATLRTDPALLRRVIYHLVAVAIMYTEGEEVGVACRQHNKRLRIEVWDGTAGAYEERRDSIGAGLAPLTDPGRQAGNGLRLRLSVAKNLARVLGLALAVWSTPGKGLLFAVDAPLATGSGSDAARADSGQQ